MRVRFIHTLQNYTLVLSDLYQQALTHTQIYQYTDIDTRLRIQAPLKLGSLFESKFLLNRDRNQKVR